MKKFLLTATLLVPISLNTEPLTTQYEEIFTENQPTIDVDTCDTLKSQPDSMDYFISSLIWVESRGNDSAYCYSERAAGCLQIRPIMVSEINRIVGSDEYSLADRWDRECSIEMFKIYVDYYNLYTYEEMARCWNGGPRGISKSSTEHYWDMVKLKFFELNS